MHQTKTNPGAADSAEVNENPSDALGGFSSAILPQATDIESACEAYAVLLITSTGKYRRRIYLSLHSATAAIQRAQDKGQPVRMVLCRLVPVAADPDLDGLWSE
jgi:hypothetical protein